jgi:hypothetical protein
MLKKIVIASLILVQGGGTDKVNLRTNSWRVASEDSRVLRAATKQDVELFVFEITSEDGRPLSELKAEYLKDTPTARRDLSDIEFLHRLFTVGEFRFVDLNGDGTYDLVASLDTTGRAFYVTAIIVRKVKQGFTYERIGSWNPENFAGHDFSKEIVDLNGDGVMEIIAHETMTEYEGAVNPIAFWPSVLRSNGEKYLKADEEFPEFYKTRIIPELEKKIESVRTRDDLREIEKEEVSSYYYLPLFRAQRIIGADRKAGFSNAVRWINTGSERLKKNAIVVFEDVGDKDSVKYLQLLAADKDTIISEKAQRALEAVKQRQ